MTDIWAACGGGQLPAAIGGELLRMVESQEQVATTILVDDLAEQALLKDLLERSKPPRPPGAERLHYPFDYNPTQRLGMAMRNADVEAFEYISARDPARGLNVALYTPAALVSRKPLRPQPWLCETRGRTVSLSANAGRDLHIFPITDYLIEGRLPRPAA